MDSEPPNTSRLTSVCSWRCMLRIESLCTVETANYVALVATRAIAIVRSCAARSSRRS
jgi:hypothetical protein